MANMMDESMAAEIAPLNIQSHSAASSMDMSEAGLTFSQRLSSNTNADFTPPATPDDDAVQVSNLNYPQPIFHHFLRTIYPFHADSSADETVTLPLNQGDVVLVHSIHTNGWADGTLLANGARGWLPTNYCESYDEEYMRGLLQALTKFWALLQSGVTIDDRLFDGQGFMQGIVAGVRYLLERSDCLRRDSPMIVGNEVLRRNRKALLADLSALVKTGKSLELQRQNTFTMESEPLANETVDEMLLKAFRIVTRGVKFLDAFLNDPRSEDITLRCAAMKALFAEQQEEYDPSTPPADITSFQPAPTECDAASRRLSSRSHTSAASSAQTVEDQTRRLSYRSHAYSPSVNSSSVRHSSMQLRRSSCLSPVPTAEAAEIDHTNLVSERLASAYDILGKCLATLLAELHAGGSTRDLFNAIRQVVHAGKALCVVVEALCDEEKQEDSAFNQVCEKMYVCISKLVIAARNCVLADEKDDLLEAHDYDFVTDSATEFVVVAGKCATEARAVIDMIGDFGIPPAEVDLVIPSFGANRRESTLGRVLESPSQPEARPPPPPSVPNAEEETPMPSFSADGAPKSENVPMAQSDAAGEGSAESTSTQSTPVPAASTTTEQALGFGLDKTITAPINFNQSFGMSFSTNPLPEDEMRSSSRQASQVSTLTTSTYMSRLRDSEYSVISQTSTRATTPDLVPHTSGHQSTNSSSVNSLAESQATAHDIHETECRVLTKSYADELILDAEGQVSAGSLPALVERLTIHDCKPDAKFVSAFYLTFRLFTTPVLFTQALIERFDYVADNSFIREPVRLRIYNVLKGWLESHWRLATDRPALPLIKSFAEKKLLVHHASAGNRLMQLVSRVATTDVPLVPRLISSMGKSSTSYVASDTPTPAPSLTRKETNLLKAWKNGGDENSPNVLELSPLELARQFTIMEMNIYNNIQPDELLACEWQKKGGSTAVNVRAMWTLSNGLVDLVKESILGKEEIDAKKRATIIKHWIKIGVECQKLNNFNCLFSIYSALADSSTDRLKKTWALVSERRMQQLEEFHNIFDATGNRKNLRDKLAEHVPPCIPFMGLYQGDLHFYHIGNPNFKTMKGSNKQLINFGKHIKTAHVISEVQRFQIPYRLTEVPDLQAWIQTQITRVRAVNDGMNEAEINTKYHKRSLAVEPRETAPTAYASTISSFGSAYGSAPSSATMTKDKFDIFSWSHSSSKEKLHLPTTETNKSS